MINGWSHLEVALLICLAEEHASCAVQSPSLDHSTTHDAKKLSRLNTVDGSRRFTAVLLDMAMWVWRGWGVLNLVTLHCTGMDSGRSSLLIKYY